MDQSDNKSKVFCLVTDNHNVKILRNLNLGFGKVIKPDDETIVWKQVALISKGKPELLENCWKTLNDLILFISDQIQSAGNNSSFNMKPVGEENDLMYLKYIGKTDQLYYYIQYSNNTGKSRMIVYALVKPNDSIRFDKLSLIDINRKFDPLFRKTMLAATDSEDFDVSTIIETISDKIITGSELKPDALDVCKQLFPLETEECHPKLCAIFLAHIKKEVLGIVYF